MFGFEVLEDAIGEFGETFAGVVLVFEEGFEGKDRVGVGLAVGGGGAGGAEVAAGTGGLGADMTDGLLVSGTHS